MITHITYDALHEMEFPSPSSSKIILRGSGGRGWPCGTPIDLLFGDFTETFDLHLRALRVMAWRDGHEELQIPSCQTCAGLMLEALGRYARHLAIQEDALAHAK